MTLNSLLISMARQFPDRVFIKFRKEHVTFADLQVRALCLAGGLINAGVQRGDRVAVLMPNCPEYVIACFGIFLAGAVAIPVNTFLATGEIAYILDDAGCRLLLSGREFLHHVEGLQREVTGLRVSMFDEIISKPCEPAVSGPDDTAVLLYTSGTTGFPKGVMLSHNNLLSNASACAEVLKVTERDRFLLFLPMFHAFSFTTCVILPLYAGARIVVLASVRPFSAVIKSIIRDRITLIAAVPAVYDLLSRKKMSLAARFIVKCMIRLRACISGAAPLPERTLVEFERRFNIPLIEGYGLTEASPVVSVNPLEGQRKPGSVGLPLPGVRVDIRADDGRSVSVGTVGELAVMGPNVMQGYYRRQEDTDLIMHDGWLFTGDLASIDPDGYIYIVDRKKDLIIVSGMNIYPGEVEAAALSMAQLEECAMVGMPDNRGGEIPVFFFRAGDGADVDEGAIRSYLKSRIAGYKLPRKIIAIDEFPKTATGKIRKQELRKWKI